MAMKTKFRSRISAAIHETASGLHKVGLIDKTTLREFDASCLTSIAPLSAKGNCGFAKKSWRKPRGFRALLKCETKGSE